MTNHPELIETEKGLLLGVHLQPGAGTTTIVGRHGDALKVRVGAPPSGGRANEALTELIAKEFGLVVSTVAVVSGETSRSKRVSLGDLDLEQAVQHVDRILGAAKRRTDAHPPGGTGRLRAQDQV